MVSTPTIKGACRIDNAFENSDKRFYKVQCPDCKEYQVLDWKQVRWDKDILTQLNILVYIVVHYGMTLKDTKLLEMEFIKTQKNLKV